MDPIFEKIINAETSAESIIRDRLQALDQWMKDPVQDPLSEIYLFFQGRKRSDGARGMSGDAIDVSDDDWTETAIFVEQVLTFLYPARKPTRNVTRDRLSAIGAKISTFMRLTEAEQRAQIENRIERQVTQLQTLTAQLNSKNIKVPGWLNVSKLEQKLKNEATSKIKELAKKKALDKQDAVDENERVVAEEEESSGQLKVDTPECLPADAQAESEEARDRREGIKEDAKARGENADKATAEDDARTEKVEVVEEEEGGGMCGGGAGGAGNCAEQTNPCECAPEPTEAEKELPVKPQLETYVVVKGDWLSKIAKEKLGDSGRWRELYELNKAVIDDENLKRRGGTEKSFNWIYPGQILTLPPTEVQPETEDNPELEAAEEETNEKAAKDPGEECDCEEPTEENVVEAAAEGGAQASCFDSCSDSGVGPSRNTSSSCWISWQRTSCCVPSVPLVAPFFLVNSAPCVRCKPQAAHSPG